MPSLLDDPWVHAANEVVFGNQQPEPPLNMNQGSLLDDPWVKAANAIVFRDQQTDPRPPQTTDEQREQIASTIEPRGALATMAGDTTVGLAAESASRYFMPEGVPYVPLPRKDFGLFGNAALQLGSLLTDPGTYAAGGLGKMAGTAALGERVIGEAGKQAMLRGSIEGGTMLGGLTAAHDPARQYIETGGVDLEKTALSAIQSTALGATLGPFGRIKNPALKLGAEVADFALLGPAMEGRLPHAEDWVNSAVVLIGMKGTMKVYDHFTNLRKESKERLTKEYDERRAAGQKDAVPNKETLNNEGVDDLSRKEADVLINWLKNEIKDGGETKEPLKSGEEEISSAPEAERLARVKTIPEGETDVPIKTVEGEGRTSVDEVGSTQEGKTDQAQAPQGEVNAVLSDQFVDANKMVSSDPLQRITREAQYIADETDRLKARTMRYQADRKDEVGKAIGVSGESLDLPYAQWSEIDKAFTAGDVKKAREIAIGFIESAPPAGDAIPVKPLSGRGGATESEPIETIQEVKQEKKKVERKQTAKGRVIDTALKRIAKEGEIHQLESRRATINEELAASIRGDKDFQRMGVKPRKRAAIEKEITENAAKIETAKKELESAEFSFSETPKGRKPGMEAMTAALGGDVAALKERSTLPVDVEASPQPFGQAEATRIKSAWAERFDGKRPKDSEIDGGRINLQKFVREIGEFVIDPVFEVVIDNTQKRRVGVDKKGKYVYESGVPMLRWHDGGTYTLVPQKFGIHLFGEFFDGQRIRVPVEAIKKLKKGEIFTVDAPAKPGRAGERSAPGGTAYSPSRPRGGQGVTPSAEAVEATVGPPPETPSRAGAKFTLRPVATPELIEISEAVTGQRAKISRRLRTNYGLFKGVEGNPIAEILINPKIAADPMTLAQTLAHEIGHAYDFFGKALTLKRGNIVGRIGSLVGYTKKWLEAYPGAPGPLTEADRARIAEEVRNLKGQTVEREIDEIIERTVGLTPKDILNVWNAATDVKVNKQVEDYIKKLDAKQKKSIIAQAIKGIIPEELRKYASTIREKTGRKVKITEKIVPNIAEEISKRVQEEIAKRRLYRADEIREELIGLSAWWSGPFRPKGGSAYDKYRASSKELYAEAVSVMLRAPKELKTRAPEFWRGFMSYLDRKPMVRDNLIHLMERLAGSPEEIAERRSARVGSMYEDAEAKVLAVDTKNEAARKSTYADVMEALFGAIIDKHIPLNRRVKRAPEEIRDKAENAYYLMDELNNLDRDFRTFIKWSDKEVLRPFDEKGISENDLNEYLLMRRIIEPVKDVEPGGDRFDVGNPLGFDPSSAKEQIAAMRKRMGDERFDFLESKLKEWNNEVFRFAEAAHKAGVISGDVFRGKIVPNKESYAAFAVVKYYEGKISGGIKKQLGTFDDIIKPFTATMMKMLSMSRMTRLNEAKRSIVNFMESMPAKEINEVGIPYGKREPTKAPPPGREYMMVMVDGKMKAYSVPKNINRMFRSHDIGSATMVGKILSWPMYKIFHPMWVTFSPGFAVANAIYRDPKRTFVNLPGAVKLHSLGNKVTWRQMINSYLRTAPTAWKKAWGVDDALIQRMEKEGTLKAFWTKASLSNFGMPETKMKRLLADYGVSTPKEANGKLKTVVSALFRTVEGMGIFGETWTNAAAIDAMERAGVPLQQRRLIVKKYAGTPDISQRGWANPVTNSLFTYSKVRWNSLQADARLATSGESSGDWWMRRTVMTMVPAIATFAAARGLFGPVLQAMLQDIPDEAKQGSSPIPVGRAANGKTMYINVMQDDTGRFLHSLTWHALNAAFPENDPLAGTRLQASLGDLFNYVVPGLNPVVEMGRVWGSYGLGNNPYDPFLGRKLLNRTEEAAGGWPATRKMLYWTMSQFGVASTIAYPILREVRGKTLEESDESHLEIASKAAVGLQRIYKITSAGRNEGYWAQVENEDQEGALFLSSLPQSARRMTSRRYLLNRIGKDKIKESDATERLQLNWWYQHVYEPYTKAIKAADAGGNEIDADALRRQLDEQSRQILGDIKKP